MFIKMFIVNLILIFHILHDKLTVPFDHLNVANTVNGHIYEDFNKNTSFDVFEKGIKGVVIELYLLNGTQPCPQGTLTLIATTTTDTLGNYMFGNLNPGKYIVRVPNLNFNFFGSLHGYNYLTPLEYCVELNGVFDPNAEEYDFGFFRECDEGFMWEQWPNCQIASRNPIICNLMILDGFCGSMFTDVSPSPVPTPLCPSGGISSNMSWFSFVAGHGNYEIVLKPINCIEGEGSQTGIQAGIYTDCSFTNSIFCQQNCSIDSINMPGNLLVPGQIYYFFINGCGGSTCDYKIDIKGDFNIFSLPFPTGIEVENDGCLPVCPGKEVRFELIGLDQEIEYTWSVTDWNDMTPVLNFPAGWPKTTKNSVTINFNEPGIYTVCMDMATNICEFRGPVCIDIEVEPIKNVYILKEDIAVLSGDTSKIRVSLENDSIRTLLVVPVQNNNILGMESDTIQSGIDIKNDILYNLTNTGQIAQYLVYIDSVSNCCVIPDTLEITVLPDIPIYSEEIFLCKDTCLSVFASIPDTTVSWISFDWSTMDTTSFTYLCPEKDRMLYVFVRDTNNFIFKIEYYLNILDFEEEAVLHFEAGSQITCSDSTLTLSFNSEFLDSIPGTLVYNIYDCNETNDSPIFVSNEPGLLVLPVNNNYDTICYLLELKYQNCSKEKRVLLSNPNYFIGKPCDDNNPLTINDVYNEFCVCQGEIDINTTDTELLNPFTVFPNPVSEVLRIVNKNNSTFHVELWSIFGHLMQTSHVSNSPDISVNVHDMHPGIYILKIFNADREYKYKIVIARGSQIR
jgi:hypothetical protein